VMTNETTKINAVMESRRFYWRRNDPRESAIKYAGLTRLNVNPVAAAEDGPAASPNDEKTVVEVRFR
jgi:hypothetical protein